MIAVGDLTAKLRALGAEVAELPTIEIQPSGDYAPLDRAVAAIEAYDWIIFTSANGVRAFAARGGGKSRARICAIGPGTRKAAEAMGLEVTLVPAEYVAESLVEAFANQNLAGRRVLLPRAAVARDVVPTELAKLGAQVDVVEAYRTGIPSSTAARAQEIFERRPRPEWITFTSSSTVKNFVAAAGLEALAGVRVASIGPVTSATARRLGVQIDVEATPYTTDALIDALVSATPAAAGR